MSSESESSYGQAIELEPDEVNYLFAIANLYILQKNYSNAEEFVQKTISLNIKDPDGYYKLAVIYFEEGDYLNAFEQITVSINKEINNTEGFFISGFDNISRVELEDLYFLRSEIAFKLMGKNDKSCDDLNKALELDIQSELIKEKINEICN